MARGHEERDDQEDEEKTPEPQTIFVRVPIKVSGADKDVCSEDCRGFGSDNDGTCLLFTLRNGDPRSLEEADDGNWFRCRFCKRNEVPPPSERAEE